jgi:hypothetical protein
MKQSVQTYKTPNLDKLFEYMSDQVAYETAKENICNYISDAVIRSKELTNSYISIYDIAEAILLDTTAFINDHDYNKINGISLKDIVESLYNAMDEKDDDNNTAIRDSSDDSEYYKKLFGTMVQKLHYDDQKNTTSKDYVDKKDCNTKCNKNDSDNDAYDEFLNVVSDGFFNQVLKNFWNMNSPEHDGENDDSTKCNKNGSADDSHNQALKGPRNPVTSSADGNSFNDIDSVFRAIFG